MRAWMSVSRRSFLLGGVLGAAAAGRPDSQARAQLQHGPLLALPAVWLTIMRPATATSRATPERGRVPPDHRERQRVTPYRRRIARIGGVYTGLGPSSTVSATTFGPSSTVYIGSP